MKRMMNLNLTSHYVTVRIFIVAEEKEENEFIEKVPIEKMYGEILKLLDENYKFLFIEPGNPWPNKII